MLRATCGRWVLALQPSEETVQSEAMRRATTAKACEWERALPLTQLRHVVTAGTSLESYLVGFLRGLLQKLSCTRISAQTQLQQCACQCTVVRVTHLCVHTCIWCACLCWLWLWLETDLKCSTAIETTFSTKTGWEGRLCSCHTRSIRNLHLVSVTCIFNRTEIASELELSFHSNVCFVKLSKGNVY